MGCTDGEGVCVRTANAELQELNSLRKKRSGSDPDPAEAGEESASRASVKEKADPSGKSRLRDHNLSVFAQTVKPLRPHAVRVVALRSRRQVLMMNWSHDPQRFPRSHTDSKVARKKKRLPGGTGAADCAAGYECRYWVGRISCENPMVLTERNDGVRGGKQAGPRVKLVSKV
jgi:hypothetical protein